MILNGWKEIASHLGRGVRTAQRWEKFGLPVHRPSGHSRAAVYAISAELEAWLQNTTAALPLDGDTERELRARIAHLEAENAALRRRVSKLCTEDLLEAFLQNSKELAGRPD